MSFDVNAHQTYQGRGFRPRVPPENFKDTALQEWESRAGGQV